MSRQSICVLLILLGIAFATSHKKFASNRCSWGGQETLCAADLEWELVGKSASSDKHTIIIAVAKPESAAATCDSLIYQVSDPTSPQYGQYFSMEELAALGLFSEKSSFIVEQWLQENEMVYEKTHHGDWFVVYSTVERIQTLINAEFYNFESINGRTIKRTPSYSIPAEIAEHIDFIGNTVNFPPVTMRIETQQLNGTVTPAILQQIYGVPPSLTVTNSGATQSLFEALGQQYSPADLKQFQTMYSIQQTPISQVIGQNNGSICQISQGSCMEANLDVEYILSMAQGAPTTYWSINAYSQDPFLDWVVALANTSNAPLVHSISYGSLAKEDPSVDVYRFNTEVCQLGLRGLTVVVATGDDGVANFIARNNASACGFMPSFPATSPYVTAVGATQGPESNQPEIMCSSSTGGIITSGGGFSVFFPRPQYQNTPVANYLKNGPSIPPTNMFNANGRAYPDVALMGYDYQIVDGGATAGVCGTSASTPVFAGMVTLVNNARLNAGKSSIGFLNPTLYMLGNNPANGIFRDITQGTNNCCAGYPGEQVCCQYGFTATTGWDPTTGFGSINFAPFLAAMLKQ